MAWEIVEETLPESKGNYEISKFVSSPQFGRVGTEAAQDIGSLRNVYSRLYQSLPKMGQEIKGAASQIYNEPARFGKRALSEALQGANKLLRVVPNAYEYAAQRGFMPQQNEIINKWNEIIPQEFDVEKHYPDLVTGNPQSGDEIAKLAQYFSFAPTGVLGAPFLHAIGSNEPPLAQTFAVPAVAEPIKHLARLPKQAMHTVPDVVAQDISQLHGKHAATFEKDYNAIFNTQGVPQNVQYPISLVTQKKLKKFGGHGVDATLDNFLGNPTTENLHWFNSALKSRLRDLRGRSKPEDNLARHTLKPIRERTEKLLHQALGRSINPKLPNLYDAINQRFAKDMAPLKNIERQIFDYRGKKMPGIDLVKAAHANPQMRARYGKASGVNRELPGIDYALTESPVVNAASALPITGDLLQLLLKKGL